MSANQYLCKRAHNGMAHATAGSIVRQIESLFEGGSVAGLTDRQLLERFTASRDAAGDAAFAALVTRYGPMVLHVCRQLLGDRHHAEDAFQAVFLVLARKARSIRDPDRAGHLALRRGDAHRAQGQGTRSIAGNGTSESDCMRHRRPDSRAAVEPMVPPADQSRAIAREQVRGSARRDRPPAAMPFRSPVDPLLLRGPHPRRGGATTPMPGRHAPQPAGPSKREAPPRADSPRLRSARSRRGCDPGLAAGLCVYRASSLRRHCQRRDPLSRAGKLSQPPRTALAREVLRTMTIHKLKTTALALLLLAAVATGGGYLHRPIAAMGDEPRKAPAAPLAPDRYQADDDRPTSPRGPDVRRRPRP